MEHWYGSCLICYIAAYLILVYVRKKNNLYINLLLIFKFEQEEDKSQHLVFQNMKQPDCWWEAGTLLRMQSQEVHLTTNTKQLQFSYAVF